MNVIVDTNVLISAIIRDSMTRELIVRVQQPLFVPYLVLDELKKHERYIVKKSSLTESAYVAILRTLLSYVEIVPSKAILPYKKQALAIIKENNLDMDDVLFLATTLALNGILWSNDKALKKQNKVKVVDTKEFLVFARNV